MRRGGGVIRFSTVALASPKGMPSRVAASAIVVTAHEASAAPTRSVGENEAPVPPLSFGRLGGDARARGPVLQLRLEGRGGDGGHHHAGGLRGLAHVGAPVREEGFSGRRPRASRRPLPSRAPRPGCSQSSVFINSLLRLRTSLSRKPMASPILSMQPHGQDGRGHRLPGQGRAQAQQGVDEDAGLGASRTRSPRRKRTPRSTRPTSAEPFFAHRSTDMSQPSAAHRRGDDRGLRPGLQDAAGARALGLAHRHQERLKDNGGTGACFLPRTCRRRAISVRSHDDGAGRHAPRAFPSAKAPATVGADDASAAPPMAGWSGCQMPAGRLQGAAGPSWRRWPTGYPRGAKTAPGA